MSDDPTKTIDDVKIPQDNTTINAEVADDVSSKVDVTAILSKYDKESTFREFEGILKLFIAITCIAFSLFHMYTAGFGALAPQIQRSVHLAFTLFLIFMLYPFSVKSDKTCLPWYDIALALLSVGACAFIIINYDRIIMDTEDPSQWDLIYGAATILLVLEATRRIVGLPIAIVAIAFLVYTKIGPWLPGMLGHIGYSNERIITHMYLTTEGIFGMPLGVSATFVFLFILFGAFLHRTGLGKFFIDLALSTTGHRVGGPAKVAVVASGFFGTISGSSVANTVSTGTFTIPLMKSVGYRPAFAAAVESAASTGGQIMPPIMGAAAFIMAQFLGMPYIEIAKAAVVPALLYYLSVGVMVHMEAKRLGLVAIPKNRLPVTMVVLKEGGYLLLPIIVLIYLLVNGYTPFLAAYSCILTTIGIAALASYIKAYCKADLERRSQAEAFQFTTRQIIKDTLEALESGARGALAVAIACACTGIVIGVVTLTGIGLKLANGIISLSGGIFFLTLLFTMCASIILGMGLPTTAKYIILATIAAPAIQVFDVPPLAAHLFVMYFGILADVTPPVALCAYAAAGIARSDPNVTGFLAVKLALAGFIIPYIFCYNPGLLMIDVGVVEFMGIAITACAGIFALGVACVGYWLAPVPLWERILLLAAAGTLIFPGLYTDVFGAAILILTLFTQKRAEKAQALASNINNPQITKSDVR